MLLHLKMKRFLIEFIHFLIPLSLSLNSWFSKKFKWKKKRKIRKKYWVIFSYFQMIIERGKKTFDKKLLQNSKSIPILIDCLLLYFGIRFKSYVVFPFLPLLFYSKKKISNKKDRQIYHFNFIIFVILLLIISCSQPHFLLFFLFFFLTFESEKICPSSLIWKKMN